MQNYSPVTHRQIGDIPGIIKPTHVPCLLEEAGIIRCDKDGKIISRRRTADEWCRLLRDYIEDRSPYEWSQLSAMQSEHIPV